MKTNAAVLWEAPGPWKIEELEVADPGPGDVQVQIKSAGLCHSDAAFSTGDSPVSYFPWIGGHEGAGVVTAVGSDVRDIEVGDHVVTVFIPSCGQCRWCASGQGNLCDEGARIMALGSGEEPSARLAGRASARRLCSAPSRNTPACRDRVSSRLTKKRPVQGGSTRRVRRANRMGRRGQRGRSQARRCGDRHRHRWDRHEQLAGRQTCGRGPHLGCRPLTLQTRAGPPLRHDRVLRRHR